MSQPTPNGAVTFGIATAPQQVSYLDILRVWKEADTIQQIDHVWLFDHLLPIGGDPNGPIFEGWTLLSALAAQTDRVRLGLLVTSNRFRPPAIVAKIAATVDIVSDGRLDFGIGVGSRPSPPAARREYPAFGLPYLDFGDAVQSLAEACTIIRRLWSESEPFDFDGVHHQLAGAFCNPKPIQQPRPPVMIGGRTTATLRVVAEHADLWNIPGGDIGECVSRSADWTNAVRRSAGTQLRSSARSTCVSPMTNPPKPGTRSPKLSAPASDTSSSDSPLRTPRTSRTGSPASSSKPRIDTLPAPGVGYLLGPVGFVPSSPLGSNSGRAGVSRASTPSTSGSRAVSSGLLSTPLTMVCGFDEGLYRVGTSGAFAYMDAEGSPVDDAAILERVRSLAIPPAWTQVWIAADPVAHLQATGIDSRGRKQYRYHPAWRHERDQFKFHDMEGFARAQPALRMRISAALGSNERLGHRQVLGLALRLLDVGLFRVGSDRYARDNRHYGLTTLRRDQVTVRGEAAQFDYVGKAGKRQQLSIVDAPAVGVLRALTRRRAEPDELLVFLGRHGPTRVHREDVNNFLRAESGGPFSAKEYRTWNATVIAAATLASERPPTARAPAVASRAVAQALGNTPTVARQSYIDPRVFARYQTGGTIEGRDLPPDPWDARAQVESQVLALLTSKSE